MTEPKATVLQTAAVYCMRERINLQVFRVAGAGKEWADKLCTRVCSVPRFVGKAVKRPAKIRGLAFAQYVPVREPRLGRRA